MNRSRPTLLLLLVAAAGCGEQTPEKPQGPELAAPELAAFLPTLKELAAAMPVPDERTQRDLGELVEIALGRMEADRRTAARVERSLLEHPDAWFVLEPALQDEEVTVRRRAAWLCGRTEITELQMPLLLRLKYESDPEAVVWVADALQQLGNDTGLAWLDAAMSTAATAEAAGRLAIAICREREIELSESPKYDELQAAMRQETKKWQQRGVGGRPDVKPPAGVHVDARLATRLATTESTLLRPIDDAKFILTRCGRLPVPLLERTLTAAEPYLRSVALEILARIGPPAKPTGPAVIKLLGDPLAALYAVRTLGEIGEQGALEYLRPMLDSIDTELRVEAVRALGLLRDEPSKAALTARLQDQSESMDVRVAAAFALCCLGDDPAAAAFLDERESKGDYHQQILAHLRERLQRMSR